MISQSYAHDGFVRLPGFLDGSAVSEVSVQLDRVVRDVVPAMPSEHVFYENKDAPSTLKQLQYLNQHDEWFGELFQKGSFRRLAEELLRGPVVPKNFQYFNKPPGVGMPTPPHQDGYYFKLAPCEAVTMWLALDHVDRVNGCVRYVRGSHDLGMREHGRTRTLGFSQGIVDFPQKNDRLAEVPCPAEPGDLLAHDALTIHWADGNRSQTRSRRALGLIYYSERAQEDSAAHAAYQQRLAEDLRREGKI